MRLLTTSLALLLLAPTSVLAQSGTSPSVPALPLQRAGAEGSHGSAKAAEKPYDESADASQQISLALSRAKKENRRVLIQWGGNWCGWCLKLHALYRSDEKIAHELSYEYDLVLVDAGHEGKNMDLAKRYDATVAKDGFPYLTILDADGKVIANQETSSFENKDQKASPGHDPKLVLEFLTKHQAPYRSAPAILEAGLADAKQSGKTVLLHFGAPWCVWCHRLEDWMARPDVAAILEKQIVDVKVDTDRSIGGKEMLQSMSHGKSGGIPWFVMLDPAGQPIIDSNGPQGNIGFPAKPDEIEHFATMLKKATKLAPADLEKLLETLKASSPPAR